MKEINLCRIFVPKALLISVSNPSSCPDGYGRLIGHQIDTKTLFIVAFVSCDSGKAVDPSSRNCFISRELKIVGIIERESCDRCEEAKIYTPDLSSSAEAIFVHLTIKPAETDRVAVKNLFRSGVQIRNGRKECDVFVFEPTDFMSIDMSSRTLDVYLRNDDVTVNKFVDDRSTRSLVLNDVTCPGTLNQILRVRSLARKHVSQWPPSVINFFEQVDNVEHNSLVVRCFMVAVQACRLAMVFFAYVVQTAFRYSGLLDMSSISSPYVNLANQACTRFRQIEYLNSSSERNNSITKWNIVCIIFIDLVLGFAVTCTIGRFLSAETLFDVFLETAEMIVAELKDLLGWLMGSPAGFKLNLPLNYSLGTFFLFHIYLWKEYLGMIKPALSVILQLALYTGVFGFTFQLSLLQDLLALSTFHVYCFYAYAAKLYGLHVAGLLAFGRLFRGKKWNPLRQRVDSFSYGTDQLFVGTLTLTVLLFLMPTTALYYIVFTSLRLLILTVQGLLNITRTFINSAPIYTVLLYLMKSKHLINDLKVSVVPPSTNDDGMLVFKIEGTIHFETQNPISTSADQEKESSWGDFIRDLIVGKLVYPI